MDAISADRSWQSSAVAKQQQPWADRWVRDDRSRVRGGQSLSFTATAKDGSGRRAFVKTLRQPWNKQARGRFRREATTYDTLKELGLPQLLDDNADCWEDGSTPLYMAMELIEGVNLKDHIERTGKADMQSAVACVRELAAVLIRCHHAELVHRDIKPANVVLRNGDISEPVLIDFGLSFNNTRDDDLTKINEEVGNRFLRLPEHATGSRSPVSDVTQLASVFLYILTGHEPRVLRDESGRMPHERPNTQSLLREGLTTRQFARLTTVLDTAFSNQLLTRYQTASDFITQLENAIRDDPENSDDLQSLTERVDEITARRSEPAWLQDEREKLWKFIIQDIGNIYKNFGDSRGLQGRHSETKVVATADELWQETCLSLVFAGDQPKAWTTIRVDRRGDEYLVRIDAASVWRGEAVDEALTTLVQRAALQQFLDVYGQAT
jgi:serine/threonine protein kinase